MKNFSTGAKFLLLVKGQVSLKGSSLLSDREAGKLVLSAAALSGDLSLRTDHEDREEAVDIDILRDEI